MTAREYAVSMEAGRHGKYSDAETFCIKECVMAEDSYSLDYCAKAPGISPIVLAFGIVAVGGGIMGLLLGWALWA
jgi:hypothetical protein